MNIGEPRREIIIEPIEEPRRFEEPLTAPPIHLPESEPAKEPVPA